ncbi:MAG: hypothetical protein U1D30_11260 [Planctomycetota bacterium]
MLATVSTGNVPNQQVVKGDWKMAYQSLNIIGSFTAAAPAIQRDTAADRDRVEAYRSLLKNQVQLRNGVVNDVDADDRMVVGDAPHERRNPYLFLRYNTNPHTENAEEGGAWYCRALAIIPACSCRTQVVHFHFRVRGRLLDDSHPFVRNLFHRQRSWRRG